MMKTALSVLLLLLLPLLLSFQALVVVVEAVLVEDERVAEYHKRNYTWPLKRYNPDTPGWRALMEQRFQQVAALTDTGARYEGYLQTINPALLAPNFTGHGFGLARCPDDLLAALQQGIRDGLPRATYEPQVEVIQGPRARFINRPDLTKRVLQELRHYAETWAQIPLKAHQAYGFRLYQNNSQLWMHVDRLQTHVVSFILHIDSSDDAEPWPIFIEDYHGRTHEVILTPGDMLFYESSKCFHGRPKKFNGSWYSSVFVHYYPLNGWAEVDHKMEAHYAIPPQWNKPVVPIRRRSDDDDDDDDGEQQHEYPKLKMVGTSMIEPDCPNEWCRTMDTVKWSGPGEAGVWIAPTLEKYPFEPQEVVWNDEL